MSGSSSVSCAPRSLSLAAVAPPTAPFPVPALEVLALNALLIWDRRLAMHLLHRERRRQLLNPGPEVFRMPRRYRDEGAEVPIHSAHAKYLLTFSKRHAHGVACQDSRCASQGLRRLGLGVVPFVPRFLALDECWYCCTPPVSHPHPCQRGRLLWRCNPRQATSGCRQRDAWKLSRPDTVYWA